MNAEVTTGSGSTLLRRDFATLVPSNQGSGALPWLNDEIVNMLFDRLVTAANEREGYNKSDSKAVPPYHAFNTNFYNTVSKRGPEAVARWSKRARIDKEKLLQCEQILIPLNPGGHWQLVIVSPKSKVIEFLCSLHLDGDTTFKHIHNWLKMELGSLYDEGDWFEVVKQSRQQANMSDCGVFTCFNGIGRVAGYDLAFDPKSMPWEGRRQLAAILLNGGFKGEFDYFHKESKDGA
ncbi:cysteine proteinase [Patellaria atrata CBS 101060]|uniref:Cysteine proteinase n=1 Tax=Patellaria atrata CBS 101060 TaxID=1346257 RepID=A0A9P4SAL4_9PEZI|nr:cysteine proteinase [Patellaria atrata CBS 101060]